VVGSEGTGDERRDVALSIIGFQIAVCVDAALSRRPGSSSDVNISLGWICEKQQNVNENKLDTIIMNKRYRFDMVFGLPCDRKWHNKINKHK